MTRTSSHLLLLACAICAIACTDKNVKTASGNVPFNDVSPLITNIGARTSYSLDGAWKYIADPQRIGYYNYRNKPLAPGSNYFADRSSTADPTALVEYDFDLADSLAVPGDWNTQKEKLYFYEGMLWYRKKFNFEPAEGKRYFLYFGAVNYEAVVGLNGKEIGHHTGGFTPFDIEVTGKLRSGSNSLVVMVQNDRRKEAVPTDITDWWNYGGITRSVKLVEVPENFILDYSVQIRRGDGGNEIYGWVKTDGNAEGATVSIPELGKSVKADAAGGFSFAAEPELWCPENPKLYDVIIETASDKVADRIGFRFVETKGKKLLLNGKEIFCKGVSIHEEQIGMGGRVTSREQCRALLDEAAAMGCNFVRLAHYPHNEDMVRLAEEMGIMVWSEIPVYWTIDWNNQGTFDNAATQLTENITRDRNRANIIIWSVANETPISEERNSFLFKLIDRAHELDGTRLVSAAMEVKDLGGGHVTVDDPLIAKTDLISFNEYMGWYWGSSRICDTTYFTFEAEKPVFISEFGAGAVAGRHGDVSARWTEEYMEDLYVRNTGMLENRVDGLVGTTPWILKDFRSTRRHLTGTQDDYNRKGLISNMGVRKSAFYVMKDWYSKK